MKRLLFGLLAATPACIPVYQTVRPAMSGMVVDADTGRPLTGAAVTVETLSQQMRNRERLHVILTKTDKAGRWQVAEEEDWRSEYLIIQEWPPVIRQLVCISSPGYERLYLGTADGHGPWTFVKTLPTIYRLVRAPKANAGRREPQTSCSQE